ncbi:MAG: hypothetical protein JRI72_00595 [Deltaproteobacteria bacterium]|nr:hypothetical protein [Deltaproteobacteria bacterium]
MPFNLEQARKDGYNDSEILSHLAETHKFNIEAAMKDGYSEKELIDYLASTPPETRFEAPKDKVPEWGKKHPNWYGAFGATKELYEKIGKPTIEMGGLVGGAAVGTPGGPVGQVAMAGAGYALSKTVTNAIDKQIARLEGIKKRTSATEEVIKSLHNIKEGMMMEMGGQAVGAAIPGMIEKVSAPFAKKITPEIREMTRQATKRDITMTPAEITGSKTLALGEALMEKIPGSTDIIREMRVKGQLEPLLKNLDDLRNKGASQQSINETGRRIWEQVTTYLETEKRMKGDALNKMRTAILAKLGTNETFSVLGLKGKDLLKAKTIAYNERVAEAYADVGNFLPEGKYQTPHLAKTARNILKTRKGLPVQDKKMMNALKWAAKEKNIPPELEEKLAQLPKSVRDSILKDMEDEILIKRDWETIHQFSKDMGALSSKEDALAMGLPGMKFQQTPEGAIYNELKQAALKDMEQIAEGAGSQAMEKLRIAKALYSKGADIYKSKEIRLLAKSNPEDLIGAAFKPNGITEIKLVKKALGPQGFFKLREGFTNKLMGVGKHDVFDPDFFRRELIRYGDEFLNEMYGKEVAKSFKTIAKEGLDLTIQRPGRSFLRAIAREYPETVVDRIIGAPEAKLQSHTLFKNIQTIKKAIKKKEFEALGENLMEKLMQLNQDTGAVRPKSFAKMVDKYSERVLSAFFPKKKVAELKTLGRIAHRIEGAEQVAGNPSGTGQTLIAWGIFRMIMSRPALGAVISFTPKQLAKIYKSNFGMKWLTEGFKVPANSKRGMELATKLSAIVYEEGNQE